MHVSQRYMVLIIDSERIIADTSVLIFSSLPNTGAKVAFQPTPPLP